MLDALCLAKCDFIFYSHSGVSASSSPNAAKFRGNTNTNTDETIRDISSIMRPEVQAGRFMHF